jgi:hypothetical protein
MNKALRYSEKCPFTGDWCDSEKGECEAIKYIYECKSETFEERKAIWLVDNCAQRRPPIQAYKMN